MRGPDDAAALTASLYQELRALAARFLGRESHPTFQPTDLVNECFVKLAGRRGSAWRGTTHFMAVSARVMRCLLVDHARAKGRAKRGGRGRLRVGLREDYAPTLEFPDQVLDIDALVRRLAELDPLHARVLELHVFAGLTLVDVAAALGLSSRTVERHWAMVRAWVLAQLRKDGLGESPS
jgi:RNA polymerase sigma factor (TIGR02999 family)